MARVQHRIGERAPLRPEQDPDSFRIPCPANDLRVSGDRVPADRAGFGAALVPRPPQPFAALPKVEPRDQARAVTEGVCPLHVLFGGGPTAKSGTSPYLAPHMTEVWLACRFGLRSRAQAW